MTETSDTVKIALIQQDVSNIKVNVTDIKTSIKDLGSMFASKEELRQTAMQVEFRLKRLESAQGWRGVVTPILTAIAGSVILFLLLSYFRHIK